MLESIRNRPAHWQATLAMIVLSMGLAWTTVRYRMVEGELQAAGAVIVEKDVQFAQDQERLRAYRAGIIARRSSGFSDAFLRGRSTGLGGSQLEMSVPQDGDYLVVAVDCHWSEVAVSNSIDQRSDVPLFVLDHDGSNVAEWVERVVGAQRPVRVVAPSAGWWDLGLPKGVTPIWFQVRRQQLTEVGIGLGLTTGH